MSAWTLSLIVVVTLIWAGMFGVVAYLAAQKVPDAALTAGGPRRLRRLAGVAELADAAGLGPVG